MSAIILPFARRVPTEAPTIPPPVVTNQGDDGCAWVNLIGTKEQLIAWRAAEERHFPEGRKRVAYGGRAGPTVRAIKGGLFSVNWHAGRNELEARAAIEALTNRVLHGSSEPIRETSALFAFVWAWRYRLIMRRVDGYEAGFLPALDAAIMALELAACAMVTYRKPAEAAQPEPIE